MSNVYKYKLNDYLPYFQIVKEYFGIPHDDIIGSMDIVESNPDSEQFVYILEKIKPSILEYLFDTWHFNTGELIYKGQALSVVYLVANLYHGDNYYKFNRQPNRTPEESELRCYDNIRKEVLEILIHLTQYKKAKAMALLEKENWEKVWKEKHKAERDDRKKVIIKEFEEDYGKIEGEDWKKRDEIYTKWANERLDYEMESEMMAEEAWKEKDQQYRSAEMIHFRFGQEKGFKIPNGGYWFDALLNNHLFAIYLDDINSIADAKEALKNNPGRDAEDPRLRAIVYGVSQFFYDYKLVSSRAPDNLVSFLQKLLELMEITDNRGKLPNKKTIKKLIENLPNAKEDPKFYTREFVKVTNLSSLSMFEGTSKEEDANRWLFALDPLAEKFRNTHKQQDTASSDTLEPPCH